LRSRGLARTNSPDRLVCDRDARELFGLEARNTPSALGRENRFSGTGFAFFEAFPDAHNGFESGVESRDGLFQNSVVGFAEILPSFAVPDNDPLAAGGDEHRGGYFAGVRSLLQPENVLRADFD